MSIFEEFEQEEEERDWKLLEEDEGLGRIIFQDGRDLIRGRS